MKCYHHNDLDGRCAAAVVCYAHKWTGNVECIEVDYKDVVDFSSVQRGEHIYIVDFSFKPEIMRKLLERTENVVWIDHHKTAAAYDYGVNLAGIRDFGGNKSGCELTWEHLFPGLKTPYAVRLIGDYDTWTHKYDPTDFQFYEGMKLRENNPNAEIWGNLFSKSSERDIIEDGKTAITYRDSYCFERRKHTGYKMQWEGYLCYFLNVYGFGSLAYGEEINNCDMCVGYIHDGKQFIVSLYSTHIDVSKIAQKYGGGGHRGASGFVTEKLPWIN